MSARTTIYVKVEYVIMKWVQVSAATLDEAQEEVSCADPSLRVLEAQYDLPEGLEEDEIRYVN